MAKMGRPGKGPRDYFMVAVPKAVGDKIRAEADERGCSFQSIIEPHVCAPYGIPASTATPDDKEPEVPMFRMTG
jgi:hypothetical protein